MTVLKTVIDVEDLLRWAIRAEYAHIHAENSGLFHGEAYAAGLRGNALTSADGCVQAADMARLGCRPDGGLGHCHGHCHPDAEAAYVTARRALVPADFHLAVGFAKAGQRPGYGAHLRAVMTRAVLNERLRPRVVNPRGQGAFCVIAYDDRSQDIAAARALYGAWWLALRRLCYALRVTRALQRHEVTGPAAPERPWEAGGAGGDSGLVDLRGDGSGFALE